jgi:DNA-binding transcriptional MocR family regulator
MRDLPNTQLDHPADPQGAAELRTALAGYLSRVRRVRVDLDI